MQPQAPREAEERAQDAQEADGHGGAELGSHLAWGGPKPLVQGWKLLWGKQRAEGAAPSQAQLRGPSTGQENQLLTHITQLVPAPRSGGGQLPGKARRSWNKGGCCLIHNKDNFLKLVQPWEQRTEPPAWLQVQGKVQWGRGSMGCPGGSCLRQEPSSQHSQRAVGEEEQCQGLVVSDLSTGILWREKSFIPLQFPGL